MQINRATDYAVRVTIHLAMIPASGQGLRGQFWRAPLGHPESFVSEGAAAIGSGGTGQLGSAECGADSSWRGAQQDISLLEVVEAIEGPTQLNLCLPPGPNCDRKEWCGAHPVWAEAQAALVKVLGKASIAQLARDSKSNLAKLHPVLPVQRVRSSASRKRTGR